MEFFLPSSLPSPGISPHYWKWNTWCRRVPKFFRSSLVHLLGGDLDVFQRFDSSFTLQALGSPGKSEKPQKGATKKFIVSSGNFCFVEDEVLHACRRSAWFLDVTAKLWNHKSVRGYHQIFAGIHHLLASTGQLMPTDLLAVLFTPKMEIPLPRGLFIDCAF